MCGIIGIYGLKEDSDKVRQKTLKMAKKIRHRGPDWSGIYQDEKCILAHERLSIVDVEHGAQPLHDIEKKRVLAVNGEIYNHIQLEQKLKKDHSWQTKSDCEVILYLYDEYGPEFVDMLNGIFAFILYDAKTGELFVARDHIGIIPLYYGTDEHGQLFFSSELKSLHGQCSEIKEFPPGHYYKTSGVKIIEETTKEETEKFTRWYKPEWKEKPSEKKVDIAKLREGMEQAVKRQLMCDVPYGVLISGGLDSSIIAAVAAKYRKKRIETDDKKDAWWPQLHSFSIGLEGSPDLKHAQEVADEIGTVHHTIVFSIQEGMDAIKDVIYHLETFDVTTVRAATPMYLMARKIKSMGIKMVLSGEGADEIFGGYLYFHMAPDKKEFHDELIRKIFALSKYDCLRANKSTAAWGLETRVPFLDKEFLDIAMSIDPKDKMCGSGKIEKSILREAFKDYLPESVLWRQKEQFSDGVGYSWIDHLKEHAKKTVTDEMMKKASETFPVKTPSSKEEYVYRKIFETHFPEGIAAQTVPTGPTIACSTATAVKWSKAFRGREDPSGRAIMGVHEDSVEKV